LKEGKLIELKAVKVPEGLALPSARSDHLFRLLADPTALTLLWQKTPKTTAAFLSELNASSVYQEIALHK